MIEFMKAVDVPFVALVLVILGAAVRRSRESRAMKHEEDMTLMDNNHREKMFSIKAVDARAIEDKSKNAERR